MLIALIFKRLDSVRSFVKQGMRAKGQVELCRVEGQSPRDRIATSLRDSQGENRKAFPGVL